MSMRKQSRFSQSVFCLIVFGAGFGSLFLLNRENLDDRIPGSESTIPKRLKVTAGPWHSFPKSATANDRAKLDLNLDAFQTEKARLAAWMASFPWRPTTDPAVIFDPALHRPGYAHPVTTNHGSLRGFFENDARFTAQFEQLFHILDEYDRSDNPVVAGEIFQNLWDYHQAKGKDPDSIRRHRDGEPVIDLRTDQPITMAQEAQALKDGIIYNVHAERNWPDKVPLTGKRAEELRDRIVGEIKGMDTLPNPRFYRIGEYERELEPGDSPLVPKVGWQAAYDAWDRVSDLDLQLRIQQGDPVLKKNFPELFESGESPANDDPIRIGLNNELLDANGQPIRPGEDSGFFGSLVTPEGERVPLQRSEDGRILIPTPDLIAVMRANGELVPAD